MGIFGSNKNKTNAPQNFDPFVGLEDSFIERNLFGDAHAVSLGNSATHYRQEAQAGQAAARTSRTMKVMAILALPLCVLGFFAGLMKPWQSFGSKQTVFAYFEVRALDVTGHPIAGAVVKNNRKLIGTTDSFGEWRQYIPVTLGETVSLSMAKKNASELLYATKNFAIPLTKTEKIEIRGTTQLVSVDLNNTLARKALYDPSHSILGSQKNAAPSNKDGDSKISDPNTNAIAGTISTTLASTATHATAESADTTATKGAATPAANLTNESTTAQTPSSFVSNHSSIWFESKTAGANHLNSAVIPALVKRAAQLGLKVDPASPWKVQLTNLLDRPAKTEKDGGGVILISISDKSTIDTTPAATGTAREFLRNYHADPQVTASGILYGVIHHTNKNVAVSKQGDRWVAALPKTTAQAWTLIPEQNIQGNGLLFNLSADSYGNDKVAGLYLKQSSKAPCPRDTNACELTTATYDQAPPIQTWTRLRLQAPAAYKGSVKIFVSGYEATVVGDKIYEYWGQNLAKVNVTAVSVGTGSAKIMSRSQIVSNAKSAPTLRSWVISRK